MSATREAVAPGQEAYLDLARRRPELFENPPGGGYTILLDEAQIQEVEAAATRRLQARGLPPSWSRVGIVYEDQYLLILRDAVRFPDGYLSTYIRVLSREGGAMGVAVLALHEGAALLVRHFRHATRRFHLEIPRGLAEPHSSPEERARIELMEEIQAQVTRVEPLGQLHVDTGLNGHVVEMFCATVSSFGRTEEHEAISELIRVTIPELERLISTGEITDSFTIAAYARAKLRKLL